MRVRCLLVLFILFGFGAFALAAYAQDAPSPDASPVSSAPDTSEQDAAPAATIRVTSNLVSLYFTARDKRGSLIPNLTRNDCTVFEDKQPQTLTSFTAEPDLPLTLGILLDTSGSQQSVLPMEQQTGSDFLKRILRSKDEAFLVSFDVQVSLLQDFTSSVRLLERAIDSAEINTGSGGGGIPGLGQGPVPVQGAPKGTLLYDAVYQASHDKLQSETGRKALILLTDGQDQGSSTKINEAIEAAQKANTLVYVLLIADRSVYSGGYGISLGYSGSSAMKKLADETGGRMIDVGSNGKKMESAFRQIEDELRTQYLASYKPTNEKLDGGFRKLDVMCNGDGVKTQARKGYYAIGSEEDLAR